MNQQVATKSKLLENYRKEGIVVDSPWEQTIDGERQQYFLKKEFGEGPWQGEPDRVSFRSSGMDCLMLRHPNSGHWCGYVAVEKRHPLYGKDYDHASRVADCHGGFTFANYCGEDPEFGVCHPHEGDDKAYWFGFDFAHLGDEVPKMVHLRKTLPSLQKIAREYPGVHDSDSYKDYAYVKAEVMRVAKQLSALRWWPVYVWKAAAYHGGWFIKTRQWRLKRWTKSTTSSIRTTATKAKTRLSTVLQKRLGK